MSGWLRLLALVLAARLAVYLMSCWIFPFRPCRVCRGRGIHTRKDGKVYRLCWWCGGDKGRLRYGRRAWNHWHSRNT